MFVAVHNLSDVNGNLIASGTKGLKPEQLGDKEVIDRYISLSAIRKQTAEDDAEESVIVTGEATDKQQAAAEKKASK